MFDAAAGALAVAVTAGASLAHAQGTAASAAYDVVVLSNVMVPMGDGVRLATDVYRPSRRWPRAAASSR